MQLRHTIRLPVRRRDWRLVGTTMRRVFSRPLYLGVALLGTVLCVSALAVARNVELFVRVVVLGDLPPGNRLAVLAAMYPFVGTGFESWTAVAMIALAVLIGVNLALIAYHVREHGVSLGTGASGSVGLIGAVLGGLGAGCAVCGISLLAGLLSLLGVGGVVALPIDGLVVTLLALGLVVLSSYWLVEGMHGGMRRRELSGEEP